ncbi:MAG: hypothetical protein QUT30_12470 [Acidobacteriota bacterium]|nr:hypothetical protein [Acidobacteriota bacterium]
MEKSEFGNHQAIKASLLAAVNLGRIQEQMGIIDCLLPASGILQPGNQFALLVDALPEGFGQNTSAGSITSEICGHGIAGYEAA